MSTYDHYEEARKVAELLEADGFSDQAKQVSDAMVDGKTGTEIFMILRFRLHPLLDAEGLSEATKQRLRVLYSKVNEALQ